jgi:hypothetical protein
MLGYALWWDSSLYGSVGKVFTCLSITGNMIDHSEKFLVRD